MQKFLLISFLVQSCFSLSIMPIGVQEVVEPRLQETWNIMNNVIRIDEENVNTENQLFRQARSYFRSCAVIVAHRCIPPCRKHYGKVSRNCNSMEKRKHLMFHLFE